MKYSQANNPDHGQLHSLEKVIKTIEQHQRFLICWHENPDGDTVGSALALKYALEYMGKEAWVAGSEPAPLILHFLPGVQDYLSLTSPIDFDGVVILVDAATSQRILANFAVSPTVEVVINIDHHKGNTLFGQINHIEVKASAVGEIIYDFIQMANIPLNYNIALCLYVALLTDTGAFRFSNTTAHCHQIVADLLNYDLNVVDIYRQIYEGRSISQLRLLGSALAKLQEKYQGKVAWVEIPEAMLQQTNCRYEDADGLIDTIRSIKGVEVALAFREYNQKGVKVNFRSNSEIDVYRLAARFGGGGHSAAAGCVIQSDLETAKQKVLTLLDDYFI